MNWEDVRRSYDNEWVLIEALEASTIGGKRIVIQMSVICGFKEDGDAAFQKYIELHKIHKDREYYIYHTSHENLDIGVKEWMGVRL